jgi:GDP-L-fucose synthase
MRKLLILGSNGLVGKNANQYFGNSNEYKIYTINKGQLDLRNQNLVNELFSEIKPDIVLNAAAKVGGIQYNMKKPTELLLENLIISTNVLNSSLINGVSKFINFGSSCMYPTDIEYPMAPKFLQSGRVEQSSEYYAMYKLVSWKIVDAISREFDKNWLTVIPSTIYGPNDNFSLEKGHVLSSLIRKFHDAKLNSTENLILWGDGTPLREFIYIDDLLDALKILIDYDTSERILNIGPQSEISIFKLASKISSIIGYKGEIIFDHKSSNGSHRKVLDSSYIRTLGWEPKISLTEGIAKTYVWYKESKNVVRF